MRQLQSSLFSAILFGLLLGGAACSSKVEPTIPTDAATAETPEPGDSKSANFQSSFSIDIDSADSEGSVQIAAPAFRDRHEDFALKFTYRNGAKGKFLMTEAMGGGVGVLDIDADGFCDLVMPQGGNVEGGPFELPSLFRSIGGVGFRQVPDQALQDSRGYGQGVSVSDFNNDGFDDVYMTSVGKNFLWVNQGDGTFESDETSATVSKELWSTSAAWGDLDRDGNLDLFVCNYLDYDPLNPLPCPRDDGSPAMCDPQDLESLPNSVFINLGDGTFREASRDIGLTGEGSKSLGVVIADFNSDNWLDVFVANDTTANFCFMNQQNGRFVERANELGCAMSGDGAFQASMGVALGDYDRNGTPDLYVTHFYSDSNTLYHGLGGSGFSDATRLTGLHQPTLPHLGFGTVMMDFNHDGHEDLLVTNGHIDDWSYKGDPFEMPPQCFSYDGESWRECSHQCGAFFHEKRIGRGIALVDVDRDGDWDPVIVHQNSPTALLLNESNDGHWIKVRLIGRDSNRRGVGVRATTIQEGRMIVQQLAGGASYCSSHEPALIFGLGDSSQNVELQIVWPSGARQTLRDCRVDQTLVVVEPAETADDDSPGFWTVP